MKNKIFANASIVTGLSIAERALGFLYRIVLSRLIGAEGLGLYQVALSLFGLFTTLGTGGIPITVSRMISKAKTENDVRGEKSAVASGVCACLLLTLPFVLILGIFGGKMTFLFSDPRSFPVFRILLLGLAFSCIYAVIRGYFWGNKSFLTPSVLEISEESVMVIVGVLLLQNVSSPVSGAEKAAWSVVISYLFSFTASMLCFFFRGGGFATPKNTLKSLFTASLPITSVRAGGSIVNSAVAVLLPVMLMRAGADETQAMTLFGVVSGMVLPILFVPSTVIGSISLVLVPELSEDFYRRNFTRLRKNLARGLRFSTLVACVLIPLFFALGKDIGRIAFSNTLAGEMITRSASILLPMSLTMISTSMLNSMGYEKQTFLFYFLGAAAMFVCILTLPTVCGVYAYVIGLASSFVITAVCNLVFLWKKGLIFHKEGEQVFDYSLFIALFTTLPLALLGRLCDLLFKRYTGEFLSVLLTAIILLAATAAVYLLAGLIPIKKRPSPKRRTQYKRSRQNSISNPS